MQLFEIYDISQNGFLPNKCINKFPENLVEF